MLKHSFAGEIQYALGISRYSSKKCLVVSVAVRGSSSPCLFFDGSLTYGFISFSATCTKEDFTSGHLKAVIVNLRMRELVKASGKRSDKVDTRIKKVVDQRTTDRFKRCE